MLKDEYGVLLRRVVFDGEPDVVDQFVSRFRTELEEFVRVTSGCLPFLEEVARRGERTERRAWVYQYLYMAVNSAVGAARLTVEGFPVPAGNLLRQLTESVAVALLFSCPGLSDFRRFIGDPEKYPFHKAIHRVRGKKIRKKLDVNVEGWEHLMGVSSRLDDFSHPSALGAATISALDGSGTRDLGGNFDPAKEEFYQGRLQLCASAVERIGEVARHVEWLLEGNTADE